MPWDKCQKQAWDACKIEGILSAYNSISEGCLVETYIPALEYQLEKLLYNFVSLTRIHLISLLCMFSGFRSYSFLWGWNVLVLRGLAAVTALINNSTGVEGRVRIRQGTIPKSNSLN